MPQSTKYTPLLGGLDLVSRPIVIDPGKAIGGLNYEPHPKGYARCDGFERYDGHPKPSAATYYVVSFDAGQTEVVAGDTVTGATSGATGVALVDGIVDSGSYGGSDAAGSLVLTAVSGNFQDDENLQVSAATVAVADGEAVLRGASTDALDMTWHQAAIEAARANIGAVNGSGVVYPWAYGGNVYAFRDNAGGTAGIMHKATTSGWQIVDLGSEISFDAGTAEFVEGETLTGGTSAATATIKRIIVESGDWTTSDADGYLILADVVGVFENNETITSAGGSATADGADAAITLAAGGAYEFRNHNFYGASDLKRMYGAYGTGKGFEFDGTVFVPIRTGMTVDTPVHLMIQRNHLFFSFAGGSMQNSGVGDPYAWSPILGAAEIGLGDDITAMLEDENGAAAIFGRQKVAVLYGNDNDDWFLEVLSNSAGGIEWTVQSMGTPLYMDNRGIRSLASTDAFGNFRLGTVTQLVEPLFLAKRAAGTTPTASLRVRGKDQYRLFFSDGSGLFIYFGRKDPEIMAFNLDMVIRSACSSEDANGNEVLFVGSNDGYVRQLDSGTSFDGEAVPAFVRLAFNHIGSPTQRKNWKKATLEMDASPATQVAVVAEFSYADPQQPPSGQIDFTVRGGGGFWDEANWDEFYWDAPVVGIAEANTEGLGTNISVAVISNETYNEPHVISGLTLHFTFRGLKR